jgi:hypothetical protein
MDAWERLYRDEQEALNFLLREEFTEMTYTISIYRGPECKAVTCTNCKDAADAIAQVQEAYPDWAIDTIHEGW